MAGAIPCEGSKNRVTGASEYKHQIDVSLKVGEWIVLVECKRWYVRVGVQEVLVLASRAADIGERNPNRKLWISLVSTQGASKNARALARQFNIKLDTVHTPREYAIGLRSQMNIRRQDSVGVGIQEHAEVVPIPESST
jgi:hypothetical protein